jgi:HEPN domain-containing protein
MLTISELRSISRARLKDADVLLSNGRYDGAAYLCGYAAEIALKARIVRTLKWSGFPSDGGEFKDFQSFKTHNLHVLVQLSGWEAKIKLKFPGEWSVITQWNPQWRYDPPGNVTQVYATRMVESARKIVEALI